MFRMVPIAPAETEPGILLVDIAPAEPSVAAANRRLTQRLGGQRLSWSAAPTTARN
jgi:hypothetical protein